MSSKPPGPSKEERNLQTQQAKALEQQRQLLERQYNEQRLLAPILYKQNNIKPTFGADGQITGFEDLGPTDEQKAYKQLLEAQAQGAQTQIETANYNKALQRLELEQQGYDVTVDASGTPTGLKLREGSIQHLQNETSRQLLERQQQALAGTLPVDPGLQRQFDRSDAILREDLRKNLGVGFETSTPGIQALAEQESRRQDAIYAAQHGEIGSSGQLAAQSRGSNTANSAYNILERSQDSASYLNPLANPGSPSARSAQLLGTIAAPYGGVSTGGGPGGGGGFGTLAQLYGDAAKTSSALRGPGGISKTGAALTGAASGAAIGTALFPGVGTAVGAVAGGLLGAFA